MGRNTDQTFAEPWAAYNGKPSIRLLKKNMLKGNISTSSVTWTYFAETYYIDEV